MNTLPELMFAVRNLRDALHERLDDNVTDRVFAAIRLRHAQAVIQARREVEDQSLPAISAKYEAPIAALTTAELDVKSAIDTNEAQMLAACEQARKALKQVSLLP